MAPRGKILVWNYDGRDLWSVFVDEAGSGPQSSGGFDTVLVQANSAAEARQLAVEYGRRVLKNDFASYPFVMGEPQKLGHPENILIDRSVLNLGILIEDKEVNPRGPSAPMYWRDRDPNNPRDTYGLYQSEIDALKKGENT